MEYSHSKEGLWDSYHKSNNHYYLTGSSLMSILNLHKINIPVGLTIMEIGVGSGKCTKELHEMGNKIIGIDICNSALNKVKKFATVFLTKEMVKIKRNSVDIAICNLVFQHCDNDMAKFILKNSFNSIKIGGFLSCQFANIYNNSEWESYRKSSQITDKKGHPIKELLSNGIIFFRTPEEFTSLIEQSIGKDNCDIFKRRVKINHPFIDWHIFKIYKN